MWPMPIVQNFAVTGCTAAQLNFSNTMSAQGWGRSVITPPIDDCFEEESPLGFLATLAFARPSTG